MLAVLSRGSATLRKASLPQQAADGPGALRREVSPSIAAPAQRWPHTGPDPVLSGHPRRAAHRSACKGHLPPSRPQSASERCRLPRHREQPGSALPRGYPVPRSFHEPQRPCPSAAALEPQAISLDVLREKYCKDNETSIDDVNARVANALADVEPERRDQHREAFLWALQQGFLPAGRIQSAAGTPLAATLINCFVQPVGDSIAQVDDGYPGIYTALTEAAETMRRGGGVGYDFSRIRPRARRWAAHAATLRAR